jgi:hypothetical protein
MNETVYEFPLEETRAAQAERRIADPNADAITDWYFEKLTEDERHEGITVDQVAKQVLHSGFAGPISRIEQMSIGSVLRETLNLERKNVMVNGVRRYKYFPPKKKDPLEGLLLKQEGDTVTVAEANDSTAF